MIKNKPPVARTWKEEWKEIQGLVVLLWHERHDFRRDFSQIAGWCASGVFSCSVIGGLGIACYQAYGWLRYSKWVPISVITVLEWADVQWAFYPQEWTGLHSLLSAIPLSIAIPAAGLSFLCVVVVAVMES